MLILRIMAILIGILIIAYTFLAATNTFVLPRSVPVFLTNLVFRWMRRLFNQLVNLLPTYEQKDRLMALYAPLSLLCLVPTWLLMTAVGYTLLYWGLGVAPVWDAFYLSGSSILTLGFASAESRLVTILAFTEATMGLILVAMLISYLPTMYAAFSKRETAVSLLDVRAGEPPTTPELVWRLFSMRQAIDLNSFWESWELWFTEIDESHTSLAALVFFRSPLPHQSWVNTAGVVLDGASFILAAVTEPTPHPALTIRAGNQALRHIADFFQVAYNPDPHFPADPIAVTRQEFEQAYDRLLAQGVSLRPDRDLAWQNFAGWRVNYDSVLRALAQLTMAPETTWLSDYTFVPHDPKNGRTGGELQKVA